MIGKITALIFSLGINLIISGCQSKNEIVNIPTIQIATVLSSTIPATIQFMETQNVTEVPVQETIIPVTPDLPEILDVVQFPDTRSYAWQLYAGGFSEPIGMTSIYNNGNILYILEQPGIIKVIQEGIVLEQPFLDIRDRVGDNQNEQGLLGIALDPNYLENQEFYLNYTNNSGDTTISRFQANEDLLTADINSEQIILSVDQPYANHNGGNLAFGPDNYLYIGLGDGGSGGDPDGNAQNLESLLGKMLRIAVTNQEFYAIPSDNPYVGGGGRAEIWASGLRNPWRYSFDKSTGALFIADVGQGEWEEINFLPFPLTPGLNFGWDYREGSHPFQGTPPPGLTFIEPVTEYDHSQGCSVTGGYVYRGLALPDWNGVYFFADYCNGKVWGLLPGDNDTWNSRLLFETNENISSFGEDTFGDLYLISHGGSIYKLESLGLAWSYLPFILN